jgi:hypothetical protein
MPCIQAARRDGSSCTMAWADCQSPSARSSAARRSVSLEVTRASLQRACHELPREGRTSLGSCLPSARLALLVVPLATLLGPNGCGIAPAPLRSMGPFGPDAG